MKRLYVIAIAVLVSCAPAKAQFGFSVVTDPGEYARMATQLANAQAILQQAQQSYSFVQAEVQMINNMPQRYQGIYAQWTNYSPMDLLHNTGQWQTAATTGALGTAYPSATNPLQTYDAGVYANMTADAQKRVSSRVATIELVDASNTATLAELGQVRAHGQLVEQQISNLEADSLSSDPSVTTMQVAQKANVAALTQARLQQDSNKLMLAIAEQQILASKRQRDAEAAAITTDSAMRSNEAAMTQSAFSGSTAALGGYNPVPQ